MINNHGQCTGISQHQWLMTTQCTEYIQRAEFAECKFRFISLNLIQFSILNNINSNRLRAQKSEILIGIRLALYTLRIQAPCQPTTLENTIPLAVSVTPVWKPSWGQMTVPTKSSTHTWETLISSAAHLNQNNLEEIGPSNEGHSWRARDELFWWGPWTSSWERLGGGRMTIVGGSEGVCAHTGCVSVGLHLQSSSKL